MTTYVLPSSNNTLKNLFDWMNERFPIANAILFFIIYLTTAAVTRMPHDTTTVMFSIYDLVCGI